MTTANAPKSSPTVSAETLALIGAAVALSLKKPHKIVSVEKVDVALETDLFILNPWSMQGRFQHFRSHNIR